MAVTVSCLDIESAFWPDMCLSAPFDFTPFSYDPLDVLLAFLFIGIMSFASSYPVVTRSTYLRKL